MVSQRCKMVVKEALNKLGLQYINIDLGVVESIDDINDKILEQLKATLLLSGLEFCR